MYAIGVDLGGTNVAVGLVDENYRLLRKASLPTDAENPMAIVDTIVTLATRLVEEAGISFDEVASLGLASPGIVDRESGEIVYSCNIKFDHFPMARHLTERLPITAVHLDNDANAAALGEAKAGGARGSKNSLTVTLGTGVGGGIIIDCEVYMGFNFAAGELGHIVLEKDGRPCGCGRRGCFEAYSSATGLIRTTREKMEACPDSLMHEFANKEGKVSGRTAFDAARAGDRAAHEVVDEYLSYLASGLATLAGIFRPEVIVIGGGLSNEKENLLAPLRPLVREKCGGSEVPALRIAELGNDAGIIGAACIGF